MQEQEVELVWCPTDENPSDMMTKAIKSPTKFDKFARWIMGSREEAAAKRVFSSAVVRVRGKRLDHRQERWFGLGNGS